MTSFRNRYRYSCSIFRKNDIQLKKNLKKISRIFYSAAVAYLNAWGKHVDDLKDLQCLFLKKFL